LIGWLPIPSPDLQSMLKQKKKEKKKEKKNQKLDMNI